MQTQIPQELSALMALTKGIQSGTVRTKTEGGLDTIAAQKAMEAQQQLRGQPQAPAPGMQDATQNASNAAQIQNMQQQQLMQAVAQMAQQGQAPQAQGILGAPGAQTVRMAEGGIAGYAGDEDSMVIEPEMGGSAVNPEFETELPATQARRQLTEKEVQVIADALRAEGHNIGLSGILDIRSGRYGTPEEFMAKRKAAEPPVAPAKPQIQNAPNPQDLAGLMALLSSRPVPIDMRENREYRAKAERQFEGMDVTPPTPAQVGAESEKERMAVEAMLRAQGIDPNFMAAAAEEEKKRTAAKTQQAQEQIDRIAAEKRDRAISDFLLGASGFKGEGLGQVFKTGAIASQAAGEARQTQIDRLRQSQLEYQDASAKEQFLLNKLRYETAMNRWDKARDTLADLKKATNDKRAAGVRMYTSFAKEAGEEGIARAQLQSRANASNLAAASRLLGSAGRGAGKPTPPEDVQLRESMIAQNFFSPMAVTRPVFRRYVPPAVLNDIAAGRIEFDTKSGRWLGPGKKPVEAIDLAARKYERDLLAETTRGGGGGATPYTEAESELD